MTMISSKIPIKIIAPIAASRPEPLDGEDCRAKAGLHDELKLL